MFERPRAGEKAVLVQLQLDGDLRAGSLAEFSDLVASAGGQQVAVVTGTRKTPDRRTFAGRGKVDEIVGAVEAGQADLVIFNHALSPTQERNLERALQCRVLDRAGLILDIFAQRARSREGQLQVELAQLRHLSTRLVRGWTHLERQKGGIGLRGPGETQLETDRRLVAERIRQISQRLQRVDRHRHQGRRARRRAGLPAVSLVGYTNAGKSTLFNRLTDADVYVANQLFATLDPTLRRLPLAGAGTVVLADTVGFISHLPHELVAAFRSTLQESVEADLVVHVVDASDPLRRENVAEVEAVLESIGAAAVPRIEVYNKVDLLTSDRPLAVRGADGRIARLWTSGATGEGVDELKMAISERLGEARIRGWLRVPLDQGRLRARLFELGAVVEEDSDDGEAWWLQVDADPVDMQRLSAREGFHLSWLRRPGSAAAGHADDDFCTSPDRNRVL